MKTRSCRPSSRRDDLHDGAEGAIKDAQRRLHAKEAEISATKGKIDNVRDLLSQALRARACTLLEVDLHRIYAEGRSLTAKIEHYVQKVRMRKRAKKTRKRDVQKPPLHGKPEKRREQAYEKNVEQLVEQAWNRIGGNTVENGQSESR